jgi:site-specific recombinase XerD
MQIPKYVELYRKDLTLKYYSDNTIKNYCFQVELFLRNHENRFTEPSKINETAIKEWLLQFKTRNSMCHSISALKLFYKLTIKQPLKFKHIEYPRSEKKLPQVIDQKVLVEKINLIENSKHKAIIALAFSTGMRVSEVVNLKISDFDLERNLIHIKNAKGRKDRIVPLSEKVRSVLRIYFSEYKPKEYLFNGQESPQYSTTSCNQIVKKYLGNDYHFHTLRHSSFTALLENGTDLRVIQSIAGHASCKTSELYTHVSKNLLEKTNMAY